jgi:hypothetical protein
MALCWNYHRFLACITASTNQDECTFSVIFFHPKRIEPCACSLKVVHSTFHPPNSPNGVKLAWNRLKFKLFGLYRNPVIIPETTLSSVKAQHIGILNIALPWTWIYKENIHIFKYSNEYLHTRPYELFPGIYIFPVSYIKYCSCCRICQKKQNSALHCKKIWRLKLPLRYYSCNSENLFILLVYTKFSHTALPKGYSVCLICGVQGWPMPFVPKLNQNFDRQYPHATLFEVFYKQMLLLG